MKASVNVNDLNKMLKTARAYIDKYGFMGGKLGLSVHDGQFEVIVVAFNNNQTTVLQQWVEAGAVYNDDFERVPAEDGFYVVDPKDLTPLKGIEKGSEVTIEAKDSTVSIISPSLAFDVNTACSPAEFPDTDFATPTGDPAETLEIVSADCECFKYIIPALSDDITRPEFTGAVLKDGALVATDRNRLHYCPLPALFGTGTLIGIISPELPRFIADGNAGTLTEYRETRQRKEKREIVTEMVATWHVLEGPGFSFKSKPINGQFPDFFRVIPRYNSSDMAEVDAKVLAKAIKPMYAGWKVNLVMKFANSQDGVKLECAGKPNEKAIQPPNRTAMIKDIKLPNLPVCLNPQFIMDALSGAHGAVKFCCMDMDSPVWIGEFDGYKFGRGAVVMPMKPF